jgi:hypothetical protein
MYLHDVVMNMKKFPKEEKSGINVKNAGGNLKSGRLATYEELDELLGVDPAGRTHICNGA